VGAHHRRPGPGSVEHVRQAPQKRARIARRREGRGPTPRGPAMKCETCEEPFPDTAAKVYRGKKVCPGCFQALVTGGAGAAGSRPRVVETKFVITTVCPECNEELHADTHRCPHCGALVRNRALKRLGLFALGVF